MIRIQSDASAYSAGITDYESFAKDILKTVKDKPLSLEVFSDDIQDNLYFSEFVKNKLLNFAVVEFEGKFIGLIRKD